MLRRWFVGLRPDNRVPRGGADHVLVPAAADRRHEDEGDEGPFRDVARRVGGGVGPLDLLRLQHRFATAHGLQQHRAGSGLGAPGAEIKV